jgi:Lon protease-like protein
MPIFPLDSAVLLPQQVLPLHIFEPRYRQLIADVLDGSGQFAMAVFAGDAWKQQYHGSPPVRPVVCVGQIVRHEQLPDGRYTLLLQGVCRARVVEEVPPDGQRLYRLARLEPLADDDDAPIAEIELDRLREWVARELAEGSLSRLAVAEQVLEYVRNDEVPTTAVLELVSFAIVTEPDLRYRLLAEGSPRARGRLLRGALADLSWLISRAVAQNPERWPKGVSWN